MKLDEKSLERMDGESDKIFNGRVEFIKSVLSDNKELKEALNLSKIWMNYKYNNCRYQPEVFNKIKKYLS
tara:strand:- start:4917 stop:5126 length:210 start_codon:yes stop_codon:yes gene_type:complete